MTISLEKKLEEATVAKKRYRALFLAALSTLHAQCGKQRPVAEVEGVYQALVARGYVKVNGTQVRSCMKNRYLIFILKLCTIL